MLHLLRAICRFGLPRRALRRGLGVLLLGGVALAQAAPPIKTRPVLPPATEQTTEPDTTEEAKLRPWPLPADHRRILPARRPDEARLRELRTDREFRYDEPAEDGSNFWEDFWNRIGRWFDDLMATRGGRLTWRAGFYTFLVLALGYAVLKILQVDLTGVFGRAPRRTGLAYDVVGENIHAVDFPARIAEAEAAGNYRLAVRLGYLEVLKRLSDQGRLRWEPDKTNHVYLHELPSGPLREAFRVSTLQFDYVWYGELALTATQYQAVRSSQRAVGTAAISSPLAQAA